LLLAGLGIDTGGHARIGRLGQFTTL
jgi:hypothetical protein